MDHEGTLGVVASERCAGLDKGAGYAATAFVVAFWLSSKPGIPWLWWYVVAVSESVPKVRCPSECD